MSISFLSPLSGIKASITRHDVSAHDIANTNTQGFEEGTPHQIEKAPRGVEISHIKKTKSPISEISNTDIAEETKEQILNKNTFGANAKVLKAKDQMLGDLIDIFA